MHEKHIVLDKKGRSIVLIVYKNIGAKYSRKTAVIQEVGIRIGIRKNTEPSTDDADKKTSAKMNK